MVVVLPLIIASNSVQHDWFRLYEPKLFLEMVISDTESLHIPGIRDAAIAPNGQILLLPSRLHAVYLFDVNGTYLNTVGRDGRGPGEFSFPAKTIFGPDGYAYIYDPRNARISIWNSSFEYVTDINFRGGWNTHFKTNTEGVFVWTNSHEKLPDGYEAIVIYEILKNPWRVEVSRTFKHTDEIGQGFLDIWSKWDITDDQHVIATGGGEEFVIFHLNESGEMVNRFGKEYEKVERSEQEIEQKIKAARRVSSQAAAMLDGGLPDKKPFFIELSIDGKNRVWVHRNKVYGNPEELDVYTLEGKFITTVTLPATKSEYRMLEIFDDKILFKVTNPDGSQELKVYRIDK
jgi:hypothetical protein